MSAVYDGIADWYEGVFLAHLATGDPLGIDAAIGELLGVGSGVCVEVGCGTGVRAARVRELGWTAVGVDLSMGMLRHARGRLPMAAADAGRLPVRTASVPAAITVMTHTDMPEYPTIVREVTRILRPGGHFVHIGVHPCFCGGFADRGDGDAVVIRPGYRRTYWTKENWAEYGVRGRVGANHWPLPALLTMFVDAGLAPDRFAEGGDDPTPIMFAIRARKPG